MTGLIEVPGSARQNLYLYVFSAADILKCLRRMAISLTATMLRCYRLLTYVQNEASRQEEPKVIVQSEDSPDRTLLETRIVKEDQFQKQQGEANKAPN